MISAFADTSANERTFLAWVRTAAAVSGFGIAASRLGSGNSSVWLTVGLLLSALAVVVVAYCRMRWLHARIVDDQPLDDGGSAADTLLLLLVGCLFVMLTLFALHVL